MKCYANRLLQSFCKEVVPWNALCHPNVLPLLGVTTDKNQLAMISEWMGNGNINEFIKAHWEANSFELVRSHSYTWPRLLLIIPPGSSRKSLVG